ncbi:hypothetical protein ABT010_34785 [Streptomyces sp. NPDC002668]|uniref:hypothetical protein n=1 Tax=Streptomyces sp. NPDC002668 TaxID=3154422 RepID=UPI0033187F3B
MLGQRENVNLLPDNGPRDLRRGGTDIGDDLRGRADSAYVFTFNALRSGTVELYAEILTKQTHCAQSGKCFQYRTLVECESCGGNNTANASSPRGSMIPTLSLTRSDQPHQTMINLAGISCTSTTHTRDPRL